MLEEANSLNSVYAFSGVYVVAYVASEQGFRTTFRRRKIIVGFLAAFF